MRTARPNNVLQLLLSSAAISMLTLVTFHTIRENYCEELPHRIKYDGNRAVTQARYKVRGKNEVRYTNFRLDQLPRQLSTLDD